MRTSLLALAFITVAASSASAQTTKPDASRTGEGNRPECTATFRQLDLNSDGKLTGSEVTNAKLPANVARNPDGSIGEVDFVSSCSNKEPLGRSSQ